ncbi:rhomboid-like protein [Streptomyces chrestomyceticus]|uniref:rhomboid-like protein n=1 Tax=Streptomyces chrestomyceticus TaxID=68185 RepID=UPI000B0F82B7
MKAPSAYAPWLTPLYVGAVQLGAYATARLPAQERAELLRAHSTNVDNLRAGRWRTLATSAVFVESPLPVPYGLALLAALGTAEAAWGTRRAAGMFAAGHIGASLLVYGGLRAARALSHKAVTPDTERAVDVGASYGFYATVGALAVSVPHRGARAAATAGVLALGVGPVLNRRRDFTDAGHLAALLLGMGAGAAFKFRHRVAVPLRLPRSAASRSRSTAEPRDRRTPALLRRRTAAPRRRPFRAGPQAA